MHFLSNTLSIAAVVALASCTSQPDATVPPATSPAPARTTAVATRHYAGEYRWREAEKDDMGGTLTVYPESDSTILFSLEANGGAPSYLMANAFGRARLRGDTATYFGKAPDDKQGCRLKIGFSPKAATVILVSRTDNDCFFGGNFTPDGTYQRTSRNVPQQVIDGAGDTLRFAHLPPDALKDSH